jgi:hypothetical protein
VSPAPLLASRGPFGPTAWGCLLVPLMLLAPFVLLAAAARSLVRPEPVPAWLLVLQVLGAAWLGYLLRPFDTPPDGLGFWMAWWLGAAGAGSGSWQARLVAAGWPGHSIHDRPGTGPTSTALYSVLRLRKPRR